MTDDDLDIDVLVRTGEVVDVINMLHELLHEERDYSREPGQLTHARVLTVAIAVLEDCQERSRRAWIAAGA